jgi:hypothetical protein
VKQEAPTTIHLIGGALSLGGMWLSLQAKGPSSSRHADDLA